MICPNANGSVTGHTGEHVQRGDGNRGYLPLGTMCETTDGNHTCFCCGYKVPGGKYQR